MRTAIQRLLVVTLFVTLFAAVSASAATYDVNTYSDPLGPGCTGGGCSLRQAIDAVNAGAGTGDSIVLQGGSYVLTQGFIMSLSKPATLSGAGAKYTTIDANLGSSVISAQAGATGSIMQDLAVTRGQSAGTSGINNDSAGLTIRRVWIHGNIASWSAAGGIHNNGTLTIEDSTISGNTASTVGGGIYNSGSLTITNSTVSGNSADTTPSGWDGGGIYTDGPTQIVNSTITGNTAATGGGLSADNSSTLTIVNSVIAGNVATGAGMPANCDIASIGSIIMDVGNMDSDSTCNFVAPSDHPNSVSLLGPLQDNGGPTPTHALLSGSAAINGGVASGCLITDQRGVARPQLGVCDSGAYEFAPPNVSAGSAGSVSANGAVISGLVGANLRASTYRVDYGKTTAYGAQTSAETLPLLALVGNQPATATLSGLSTSTTYHFRIVATNADGSTLGPDATFTTARFAGATLVSRKLKINSRGRISIRVRCPLGTIGNKCDVIANLFAKSGRLPAKATAISRRAAKRFARQKFAVTAGSMRTVSIRLSRSAAATLRSRNKTKLRLLLTARDGDRHRRTRSYKVTVKS